jgi:secondary thiamine-phosphate synthase enzyme
MPIINQLLELKTERGIGIYDLTLQVKQAIAASGIGNGQEIVFARHTTTALVINEYESRLLEDLKNYLRKLAPPSDHYLHNDLHLRGELPEDEPINAHSHLMAMTLNTSEVIPIMAGELALGVWLSILLIELDGPRQRTVVLQLSGE